MITMVGKQKSLVEAIKTLVALDYDALVAYEVAVDNLENYEYKKKFNDFAIEHRRHIIDLGIFLSRSNEECPNGTNSLKKLLIKGKIELVSLFGDQNILNAILGIEENTNSAYEGLSIRITESFDAQLATIIANGLDDERNHKIWLEANTADSRLKCNG